MARGRDHRTAGVARASDQLSTGRSGSEPSHPSAPLLTISKKSRRPSLSTWISMSWPRAAEASWRVVSTLPSQVLRWQTSLVERPSQIDYLRRQHDVGDVLDSRPGSGEAFLDALGRQPYGFDQLDRAVAAVAESRVVNELRRLTAREDVLQRHVLDEEERPGAELIGQAAHGRLDVLDDVGGMVRLAELRSEEVLRHGDSLSVAAHAEGLNIHHINRSCPALHSFLAGS